MNQRGSTHTCTPAGHRLPGRARPRRGFTLVELMVTIAVAAILLAIAVPSFKHAISSTHLGGASNELLAALKYARAEAITRGSRVAVEASSSGHWNDGWSVVATAASAGGSDAVLRRHDALQARYRVGLKPAGVTQVAFGPQGAAGGNETCFTLEDTTTGVHTQPVNIVLLPSGSIHSVKTCPNDKPTP